MCLLSCHLAEIWPFVIFQFKTFSHPRLFVIIFEENGVFPIVRPGSLVRNSPQLLAPWITGLCLTGILVSPPRCGIGMIVYLVERILEQQIEASNWSRACTGLGPSPRGLPQMLQLPAFNLLCLTKIWLTNRKNQSWSKLPETARKLIENIV